MGKRDKPKSVAETGWRAEIKVSFGERLFVKKEG